MKHLHFEEWGLLICGVVAVAALVAGIIVVCVTPACEEYGEVMYYQKVGDVIIPVHECRRRKGE